MKLEELARLTGARVEEKFSDVEVVGAAGLDEADAGQVSFLANPRYTQRVQTTRASAIYVGEDVETGRDEDVGPQGPNQAAGPEDRLLIGHGQNRGVGVEQAGAVEHLGV